MTVRVYGVTLGGGSWKRVTDGVVEGLKALGAYAGIVPIDVYDEEESYPGFDAETAIGIGPPLSTAALMARGLHKKRVVMIAPNSTWVSDALLRAVSHTATEIASPSLWGKEILDRAVFEAGLTLPVSVYRHGVTRAFAPNDLDAQTLQNQYDAGCFRILHFASTSKERKGTRLLVEAFERVVEGGDLAAARPELDLVLEGPGLVEDLRRLAPKSFTAGRVTPTMRLDASPSESNQLYHSAHLVCQPSRGEGFGLVPLEAAASGAVVAMTRATGHTEYADDVPAVIVGHGAYAPIDDGPGAMAPSVSVEAVARALLDAHTRWRDKKLRARHAVALIGTKWSWEAVTDSWLRRTS